MAALRIYFTDALHSGAAAKSAATSGAAEQLLAFINSKYAAYQTALLQQLQAAKPSAVQHAAVQALMECTRAGALSSVKTSIAVRLSCVASLAKLDVVDFEFMRRLSDVYMQCGCWLSHVSMPLCALCRGGWSLQHQAVFTHP